MKTKHEKSMKILSTSLREKHQSSSSPSQKIQKHQQYAKRKSLLTLNESPYDPSNMYGKPRS